MNKRKKVIKKLNPKAKQKGKSPDWIQCKEKDWRKLEDRLFTHLEDLLRDLPKSGTKTFIKKLSALIIYAQRELSPKSACFLVSTAFRHPALDRCYNQLTKCPEWKDFANKFGEYILFNEGEYSYESHEKEYKERRNKFIRSREWK